MIKHIVSWFFSKVVSEKGDIMSEKRRDRKNRVLRMEKASEKMEDICTSTTMQMVK